MENTILNIIVKSEWRDTYKDLHSTVQNRFDTLEEAKEECLRFAESQEKTRTVWEFTY